jgi:hypothetical protein
MKQILIPLFLLLLSVNIKAQDAVTNTGNLHIDSGGNFVSFGNFTNNGTFTNNGGTFTMAGSMAQSISGSSVTNFYNLDINNISATGVTLSGGNVTVSNVLTLSDGFVYTSGINPLILADNATITGGSSSSYVIGPLSKTGDDAFTFQIGKDGYYMPITFTAPNAVTDAFTAEYFRADPNLVFGSAKDTTFNKVSNIEYWTLVQNTGTSSENVTLNWNGNTSGIGNLSELRVAGWDGSQWINLGNASTTGNDTAGTILSSTATSNYTAFTLASTTANNPLPITLLTFKAVLNNDKVDLNWATATEVNNDYFTVEKTRDGKLFEFVAKVNGAGNSNQILSYFTIDPNPYIGLSYYRLKQSDYDGKISYSEFVPVRMNDKQLITVYPNPSLDGNVNVLIKNDEDLFTTLYLSDINGKIYKTQTFMSYKNQLLNLQFDNLAKGVYILKIEAESGVINKKLIIN